MNASIDINRRKWILIFFHLFSFHFHQLLYPIIPAVHVARFVDEPSEIQDQEIISETIN